MKNAPYEKGIDQIDAILNAREARWKWIRGAARDILDTTPTRYRKVANPLVMRGLEIS
ncbi:MAG: hypothetical protein AAGC96_05200 [Pseudomonadota bacterium]